MNSKERKKLIMDNIKFVHYAANRIAKHLPPEIDIDDLKSVGTIGLIKAVDKYDPDINQNIGTYAYHKIKGAILSELRSRDYLTRTIRKKIKFYEKSYLLLEKRLNRKPQNYEVAEYMKISLEELYDDYLIYDEIANFSIEEFEDNFGFHIYDIPSINKTNETEKDYFDKENRLYLKELINSIKNLRHKDIIKKYCYEDMTMKEIGEIYGVTESRISQIWSKFLTNIKNKSYRDKITGDIEMEIQNYQNQRICNVEGCNNVLPKERKVNHCSECHAKRIKDGKQKKKLSKNKTKKECNNCKCKSSRPKLDSNFIILDFSNDQGLLKKLKIIASNNRRTIDNQILYILDKEMQKECYTWKRSK